ncbi:hypothetical protein [Halomonas sp. PA16-9]|uniref:hypothetical protein n=1 Tax=Halomonas sp. PA16-9 TaxID=2576841 RepID=UPI0012DA6975|nr:hypothetical protein FDY98_24985 [Halomonas sp. PA16-9]
MNGIAALPASCCAGRALHHIAGALPGEILGTGNAVSLGQGRWRVIPVPHGLVGAQVDGHLSRRPIVACREADAFRGQPVDDLFWC